MIEYFEVINRAFLAISAIEHIQLTNLYIKSVQGNGDKKEKLLIRFSVIRVF